MDIIPQVHASGTQALVPIGNGATDVNIVSVNGQSIFGGMLPINIKDVETTDKLYVEVHGWKTSDQAQVDVRRISTSDRMPVEVKNNYVYIKSY